jgi:hypothetical protein
MVKMALVPPKIDKIEDVRKKMEKKPKLQPASTKKWEAIKEHQLKEDQKKREKQM